MSQPIRSIRNVGPALEAEFARAGLTSAEEVCALGADAAYLRLLDAGSRPHFMAFMALSLGLQDRPWIGIDPVEKAGLRERFDALSAQVTPQIDQTAARLARTLSLFGVGAEAAPDQPTSSRPEKK